MSDWVVDVTGTRGNEGQLKMAHLNSLAGGYTVEIPSGGDWQAASAYGVPEHSEHLYNTGAGLAWQWPIGRYRLLTAYPVGDPGRNLVSWNFGYTGQDFDGLYAMFYGALEENTATTYRNVWWRSEHYTSSNNYNYSQVYGNNNGTLSAVTATNSNHAPAFVCNTRNGGYWGEPKTTAHMYWPSAFHDTGYQFCHSYSAGYIPASASRIWTVTTSVCYGNPSAVMDMIHTDNAGSSNFQAGSKWIWWAYEKSAEH
jgi:hypothetical protein